MGLKRTSCFMVLALLLFAWASTSSVQEDIYKDQVLIKQLVNPLSEKFDHALVEEFLFNCKLDLINPRTIRLLSPRAKQTYLNCLRRRKTLSLVSGEEKFGSKSWFSKYFEAIYRSDEAPRRRSLQTLLGAEAPAPGPAFGSPSPSPGPVFIFSPPTPVPGPPAAPFFPPSNNENTSSSPGSSSSSGAASGHHTSRSSKNSVAIAVAVTASVTFFVVVLLFLCCGGYCGPGSKLRRNDERPLLSLSLTDFTLGGGGGGASPQFYQFGNGNGNGNPNKDDRVNHHNLSNHHSMTSNSVVYTSSPQSTVSSASSVTSYQLKPPTASKPLEQMTNPPLKPPPGWALTSPAPPPARPPLRPPPGRAEPLPPEPRSSFKPPSTRHNPPLPTPFVAPAFANSGPPSPPPSRQPPPPPPPAPRAPPPPPPPASRGPPPPPPPRAGGGPPPPPPPRAGGGPPPPRPPSLPSGSKPPPPPKQSSNALPGGGANNSSEDESDAPKAKLKPFFWDKVMANPDQSMVWHQIKSGSFQFDENMIESLFGTDATEKSKNEQKKESSSQDPTPQFIQIIDAKKSQNLAILLRALNVTLEEVCDALLEGNELPSEFVQNLLKMTPTADEELKLRLFSGDPSQLGTAERFLKALVDIPFAFKRLEALLFMSTLTEEVVMVKESFQTLEVACKELRNSRLFLKLLEAVLKTGNRMNDGTFRGQAQAFKLDTLLKLSDVRGTDGKTTLLLFVVREIIRSEGVRAVRMAAEDSKKSLSSVRSGDDLLLEPVSDDSDSSEESNLRSLGLAAVSGLGDELGNVKKASVLDADGLTGTVARLGQSLLKTRNFLKKEAANGLGSEESGFGSRLEGFVRSAEAEIVGLLEEEKRIMTLVRSTGDYFHGNSGKDEGLRLFVIVRDFLVMVDKACREVREASKARPVRGPKKETSSSPDLRQLGGGAVASPAVGAASPEPPRMSPFDLREKLFPAIADRRVVDSSSDDET